MEASSKITLDARELDRLMEKVSEFGSHADRAISDYLREDASKQIMQEIIPVMPASRKTWKGKKRGAKNAAISNKMAVFQKDQKKLLEVDVWAPRSKGYGYLYFPDDGTNTVSHAGMQFFMFRGATNAKQDIIDGCIERLVEKMKE